MVIDRFHVQKSILDTLQVTRIKHSWDSIDAENDALEYHRNKSLKHIPKLLSDGDTRKQLLARSRYLLYKLSSKWTDNQRQRAGILCKKNPDLGRAYRLCQNLSWIFNNTRDETSALVRLAN